MNIENLGPILVVEDEFAMRQSIRWALEGEGYVAADAGTAEQAVAEAQRERPCLVLLDYGLPDGDGSTVADQLRGGALDSVPPIIVLTADGRAAEKASRVGAVAYMHKPFDMDELLNLIKTTVGAGIAGG